ncbi:beta-galactosidase [Kribbella sp. NPDC059898]|uniref:beta-galactosidase n=1 Tax=Kribbella sp. NPDC059898 TaxID=3346995 RepID=UPI003657FFC3
MSIQFGGDYNPEQWDEATWIEDVALMRAAGVTMVTVGVFSWARLEPVEGEYEFGWLDRVLELLHEGGIKVCLATPTAAPPAWMARRYPETLSVDRNGQRRTFGSRAHFCPSSPRYRQRSAAIADALAERYADHPALALWHINNEYNAECYCDVSAADFRAWLRERYGTIEALNETWGTAVWGQTYAEWAEVEPPRPSITLLNPARLLDWRRFVSDATLACFVNERDAIRRRTPGVPVTTNFMTMHKTVDHWTWAAAEDVVALDAYPDPHSPTGSIDVGLEYDRMRSLRGGQPWLLLESATSAVGWRSVNSARDPGQLRVASMQAVARGADAVMFFQWRASRRGAERFHSAMVPHSGPDSRIFREVSALGHELGKLAELAGTTVSADVAIVWDWTSWTTLDESPRRSEHVTYGDQVLRYYRQLWHRNIAVDLVRPTDDLSAYRLVLLPAAFALDENPSLVQYVADGGHLLASYATGTIDTTAAVHAGGAPGPLREVLGLRVEEANPLPAGVEVPVDDGYAVLWQDIIVPETATVLSRYTDGPWAGTPVVTANTYGAGIATYVGATLSDPLAVRVLDEVCRRAGVHGHAAAPMVEVVERRGGEYRYHVVLNHQAVPVDHTAPAGVDLLTGTECGGEIRLQPYDVKVIRLPATA